MKTDLEGRQLVESAEGLHLKAYPDPATGGEPWTIGYGHTSAAGVPKVVPGMVITAAQADQILAADLARFESAVMRAVTVPMSQHEFDACVDLCFNIGPGNFAGSSVVRLLNAGDRAGAAMAFAMWTKAAGRVLPGLVARRKREAALFVTPDARPATPAATPGLLATLAGGLRALLPGKAA